MLITGARGLSWLHFSLPPLSLPFEASPLLLPPTQVSQRQRRILRSKPDQRERAVETKRESRQTPNAPLGRHSTRACSLPPVRLLPPRHRPLLPSHTRRPVFLTLLLGPEPRIPRPDARFDKANPKCNPTDDSQKFHGRAGIPPCNTRSRPSPPAALLGPLPPSGTCGAPATASTPCQKPASGREEPTQNVRKRVPRKRPRGTTNLMTLPHNTEKSTLCGHSIPTVAQGSPPPQRPCPLRLRREATRLAVIISTCTNHLDTHR